MVAVVVSALTGCNGETSKESADPGDVASSEETPSAGSDEEDAEPRPVSRCDALVSPKRVTQLVGIPIEDSTEQPAGELQFCQWTKRGRELLVVDGPAAGWSAFLGADIEAVQSSGTPITPAQEQALKAGLRQARTGDGVCSTVTTLAQVWSGDPGAEMVRLRQGDRVVRVDACEDGRFTRVLIDAPSVTSNPDAMLADAEALVRDLQASP